MTRTEPLQTPTHQAEAPKLLLVRFSQETHGRLHAAAYTKGTTMSDLVRQAVAAWLHQQELCDVQAP